MSPAQALLDVLKEEEKVLLERRYEALTDIASRKQTHMSQLDPSLHGDWFERIRTQASKNERLMSVAITAIRGLKNRFSSIGQEQQTVGYSADGSRMGMAGQNSARRV